MARTRKYAWLNDFPPPDLLAAIARIILLHNHLERAFILLLCRYLRVRAPVRAFLFNNMNNKSRLELIRALADEIETDDEAYDSIEYAIKCFGICAENRNIVAHSEYDKSLRDGFMFRKCPSLATPNSWRYKITTPQMIACGASIHEVNEYVELLAITLLDRRNLGLSGTPEPLPDKPPQPRKLSLLRLPEDR